MELHQAPEAYSRIIHYDEVKQVQVRLTINTFHGCLLYTSPSPRD